MDFKSFCSQLEEWTRAGERSLVVEAFNQFDQTKCSIDELVTVSKIANRNHLYSLSLRFLFKTKQRLSEQERALPTEILTTYASALLGIGATDEAQDLLRERLDNPSTLFSYSLSQFSSWNYRTAVTCFEKYLRVQTNGYMHQVGRLNLIAAHLGTGAYERSFLLLKELMADIKDDPQAVVLYGNCWEIKAQIEIEAKEYKQALASLAISKTVFKDQLTRYLLYVNKWEAVAQLAQCPDSVENQRRLIDIQRQAKSLRNWETIRDCDFQMGRYTLIPETMQRVLMGTPYQEYHLRVKKLYGFELAHDASYNFVPSFTTNPAECAEMQNDAAEDLNLNSPPSRLLQQPACLKLLHFATKDFYKPPRFGVLHHHLHPGELYNPFTSPQRIRSLILRLNKTLKELGRGLRITVSRGDVFLSSHDGTGLVLRRQNQSIDKFTLLISQVCLAFKGRRFTRKEVEKVTNGSARSCVDLIKFGIRTGRIQKFGAGRSIYYKLSNHRARSA